MMLLSGRRVRLIVASCLCLLIAASGASLAARHQRAHRSRRPQSSASLTKQLHAVQGKKRDLQRKLRVVTQQERSATAKLNNIDKRLDQAENRYQLVTKDVNAARAELGEARRRLLRAESDLRDRRDAVADRLVTIYQEGEIGPLEVVLQSSSFADFANGMYLVNHVAQRDAEILDDLSAARDRADEEKQRQAEAERSLTDLQRRARVEKSRVEAKRQQAAQEKASLMRDREYLRRALEEQDASERQLAALLWRYQRSSRGRAGSVTPWKGSLYQPVSGRITSGYGYRVHPILGVRKLHTGVDIAARSGTPIHAAASGVVVSAGWVRGYGNCIVLDHGGGLGSLYGHCSSLAVSSGQQVKAGQVIGSVGSTGLSTGPHLHFEVLKNGRHVNPMGSF